MVWQIILTVALLVSSVTLFCVTHKLKNRR